MTDQIESVLYVGSGLSAKKANDLRSKVDLVCAVNNAWRVFAPQGLDYWIYPGDFPPENFPPCDLPHTKIDYPHFADSAKTVFANLGEVHPYPQHRAGYTIFFQGLYWLFDKIKPKRIYTLGFDHDYTPEKVRKWLENQCPAPHNKFNNHKMNSVNQWVDSFFEGCAVDAIYGHGTPDPLRLGEQELRSLFDRALHYSQRLGIQLFNASDVTHGFNNFPQSLP